MQPKISIIVPIYNVETYLEECLDSILSQTFTNFELILVNDGSTDDGGQICDRYKEKDSRIRVIHKENGGVSSARNTGIDEASGKYIGFIDPDDTVESDMYKFLFDSAEEHDAEIVICPINTINLHKDTRSISRVWKDVNCVIDKNTIEKYIIPAILLNKDYSIVSCVNKLYKKSLFQYIKFVEGQHHGEDARLNFTLMTIVENIIYLESPLYNYLLRKRDSLTQVLRDDLYLYVRDNKRFLLELAKKYNKEKYSEDIRKHFTTVTLSYIQDVVSSDLNKKAKNNILSLILNDKEFREDIYVYKGLSKYYRLLKVICILKNTNILYIFIKSKIQFQNYKLLKHKKFT